MTAGKDLEIRGQTVEEAIETGLSQLGLNRSDVIVDVVDEGSKGILGIGARDAVVRLVPMVSTPAPAPEPVKETKEPKKRPAPPEMEMASKPSPASAASATKNNGKRPSPQPATEAEIAEEREIALEVVGTILAQMQVEATIDVVVSEPDDLTGRQVNELHINGNDLGVLIGPRGDTLNSLQYITRLMVGHRLHRRADFVIDIEGYRERRKQALSRLANRMANKVVKQNRPVTLEAMPAYERRIIHMSLRDHEDVYTQSTGEGNRRRVRILPKK